MSDTYKKNTNQIKNKNRQDKNQNSQKNSYSQLNQGGHEKKRGNNQDIPIMDKGRYR